jgi:phosphatidylglycerophosphatase A
MDIGSRRQHLSLAQLAIGEPAQFCGTRRSDPCGGSIVLDEITAMPLCFVLWLAIPWFQRHELPVPGWQLLTVIFILFRIFDIAKPWPIRRTQKLPGGWGVTVDDALAAIYVAALSLLPALFQ